MKTKDNILKTVVIIIYLVFNISASVFAQDTTGIEEGNVKKLRIGISPRYNLYCYKKDDGYQGFNIDVIYTLSMKAGYSIELVEVPENEVLLYLITDRVDVIAGMNYNHIPDEYIVNTQPFYKNSYSIFTKRENSYIKTLDDLSYCKIIYCSNDPYADILTKAGIDGEIYAVENMNMAYAMLNYDLVDAYIGDTYLFANFLYSKENKNLYKSIGDTSAEWLSTFVSLPENIEIINKLDKYIDDMKTKDDIDNISAKWFGKAVIDYKRLIKRTIAIAATLTLSLIGITLFTVMINRHLKKQISQRINDINNEKLLKESIINSMINGLIFIDKKGFILAENQAAREILDEAVLLNRNLFTLKNYSMLNKEYIDRVLMGGECVKNIESLYGANGKKGFLRLNITPTYYSDKSIMGVTIIFMDITEEKRLMYKLTQKDKLETTGRLTASIAHEIRNPLTAIDMYVKLLPEKIDSIQFRQQMMEDIPKEIKRLNNIIQEVLDYANPREVDRSVFNLKDEINLIIRLIHKQIDNNNIELIIDIDSSLFIIFDRQQFKQVIINLIINSIDELRNSSNARINIKGYQHDNTAVLEVSDNGSGINDDIRDKIFEPFFTTKAEGHGLGLMIVRQIIEENKADICIDENYENGAKFIITMEKESKNDRK